MPNTDFLMRQRGPAPAKGSERRLACSNHSAAQPDRCRGRRLRSIAAQRETEVSICINKTCKKQGSKQIAQFAKDMHLSGIIVRETGCLGKCGNGPNVAVSPPGVVLNHMATPARFAEAMTAVCGADVSPAVLRATELRLVGNAQAREGDWQAACASYSEALDLGVSHGRHLLLANRSGARLQLGDRGGALRDADAAVACAPPDFHTAVIRQVEAHGTMQNYRAADAALRAGGERDPAFAKTQEYRNLAKQLAKLLLRQPVTAQ